MLPTSTLSEIKSRNGWCGDGRRKADSWHRSVGKPKLINAYDIARAMNIQHKRGTLGFYRNRGLMALCQLIDQDTADAIVQEIKSRRLPHRCSWMSYRAKRYYPKKVNTGQKLYNLLETIQTGDQINLLIDVLGKRA